MALLTRGSNLILLGKKKFRITDTFSSPDSANIAGRLTEIGGKSWSNLGTVVMGIQSGYIHYISGATGGDVPAIFDTGRANFRLQAAVVLNVSPTELLEICFRVQDVSNFYFVQVSSTGYRFYKKLAGSFTNPASFATTPLNGDVIEVRCAGTTMTCLRNGAVMFTVTDSSFSAATKVGYGIGSPANGANANGLDYLKVSNL